MRKDEFSLPTRRDAMAAGLAAAGALAFGARSRTATAFEGGPYGPFKMGLQSYSLRAFKLDEALEKTKALGLAYWESYRDHVPVTANSEEIAGLRRRTEEAGVSVVGYGVIRFTKDHEANHKIFNFAKAMGIVYLSADPDPDSFESLDDLVASHGVAVGIHNHGPGHRYGTIDSIAEAIKDHHPKIGCCIDTGHFLRSEEDPLRAAEVFEGANSRRSSQGRQGRQGIHHPRRGRPQDRRAAPRPPSPEISRMPGSGI